VSGAATRTHDHVPTRPRARAQTRARARARTRARARAHALRARWGSGFQAELPACRPTCPACSPVCSLRWESGFQTELRRLPLFDTLEHTRRLCLPRGPVEVGLSLSSRPSRSCSLSRNLSRSRSHNPSPDPDPLTLTLTLTLTVTPTPTLTLWRSSGRGATRTTGAVSEAHRAFEEAPRAMPRAGEGCRGSRPWRGYSVARRAPAHKGST
jgi:hypothetical protein